MTKKMTYFNYNKNKSWAIKYFPNLQTIFLIYIFSYSTDQTQINTRVNPN